MLFTAVVALTESVCCVCGDKHHIKKNTKKPTEATNYKREDCIYVTAEAMEAMSASTTVRASVQRRCITCISMYIWMLILLLKAGI